MERDWEREKEVRGCEIVWVSVCGCRRGGEIERDVMHY